MTDRGRVALSLAAKPEGRVQVLPVTESEWRTLLEQGHPRLAAETLHGLRRRRELTRFQGESGQTLAVDREDGVLWLVGRGKDAGSRSLRRAAAVAAGLVPSAIPWSLLLPTGPGGVAAAAEGVQLGSYRFRIGQDSRPVPGPCTLVSDAGDGGAAALRRAQALCEGVLLTRDLVNTPAGDLGPAELAAAAHEVAGRHGMSVETFEVEALRERGFGLIEAVGRASSRSPNLTVMRLGPVDEPPALALVGKGVVFDTGGLDIKTAAYMALMRKDMGGAGTVLGIMDALGRLGVQRPVMALLPAAENSVGPDSYRPGDILRSYSGKTVEIGNTDAEGRLLLADAISLARESAPARLLDLATLTGAARVALGPDVPALFGTDEPLVDGLLRAGQACDEPLWRMPLVDDYDSQLDSPWADMNHVSSDSRGGSITAALFLRRFVGDTPWAHIDLYAWEDKGRPEAPKGANGSMVRAVTEAVLEMLDAR